MMIVIVTGSRNYTNQMRIDEELNRIFHIFLTSRNSESIHKEFEVWHGGASGADTYANDWCHRNKITVQVFPANWCLYGKAAGPIRNNEMLNAAIIITNDKSLVQVLAFPLLHSRGTRHMIRIAQDAGVQTTVIEDNT